MKPKYKYGPFEHFNKNGNLDRCPYCGGDSEGMKELPNGEIIIVCSQCGKENPETVNDQDTTHAPRRSAKKMR